jgi:hypothetical protein
MTKIKMLVDEVIANVIEDEQDKGPKAVIKGEIVDVWDGVAILLVAQNQAEYVVGTKHTEQPKEEVKEEKPKKSKK